MIPMSTIFAVGETIYDIIFVHGQPKAARPGGSMLNTAVSLGRCGLKVEMITELGADQVGQIVLNFLTENGVSTSFIKPSAEFKTPVSLAFLDEKGNANYSFYIKYPEGRLNSPWPVPKKGDVVLFGSFYSLDPGIRQKIVSFLEKAKLDGAFIVYDPNIRKNHLEEIRKLFHLVKENIALADIVRGSDEDFENLFGTNKNDDVYARIQEAGSKAVIITRSREGVDLLTSSMKLHTDIPAIRPVSTIGAGDAFNAGIIVGLVGSGLTNSDPALISLDTWKEVIDSGIIFASDVCQNYDNYISNERGRMAHGPR
jgi:fructokinase